MRTSKPSRLRRRGRCRSLVLTGLPANYSLSQTTDYSASISIEQVGKRRSRSPW
jgi:hypothetical protein